MSYISVRRKRIFKILATSSIMLTSVAVPSAISFIAFGTDKPIVEKEESDKNINTNGITKQEKQGEDSMPKKGEAKNEEQADIKKVEEKNPKESINASANDIDDKKIAKPEEEVSGEKEVIKKEVIKWTAVKAIEVIMLKPLSNPVDQLKLQSVYKKITNVIREKLIEVKSSTEVISDFDVRYAREMVSMLTSKFLSKDGIDVMKLLTNTSRVIEDMANNGTWTLAFSESVNKISKTLTEPLVSIDVQDAFNNLDKTELLKSVQPPKTLEEGGLSVNVNTDITNIANFINGKLIDVKKSSRDDGSLLLNTEGFVTLRKNNDFDERVVFEQNDPFVIGIAETAASTYNYKFLPEKTSDCTYYFKHNNTGIEIAVNIREVFDEKKVWHKIQPFVFGEYNPLISYTSDGLVDMYLQNKWFFPAMNRHFLTSDKWLNYLSLRPVVAMLCEVLEIPFSLNWKFNFSINFKAETNEKNTNKDLISMWNLRNNDATLKLYHYEFMLYVSNKNFPLEVKRVNVMLLPEKVN